MHKLILSKLKKYKTSVEVFLAFFILLALYINDKILTEVSFFNILECFLSFIILVEVIRMLGQYLTTSHISVTLMIEMVILFICRDILLMITNKNYLFVDKALYICLFLFILSFFFYFRQKTIQLDGFREQLMEEQNK